MKATFKKYLALPLVFSAAFGLSAVFAHQPVYSHAASSTNRQYSAQDYANIAAKRQEKQQARIEYNKKSVADYQAQHKDSSQPQTDSTDDDHHPEPPATNAPTKEKTEIKSPAPKPTSTSKVVYGRG